MNRSQDTVKNYLNDDKRHADVNNKSLRHLGYLNYQLYQMELVKSEIERKESIFVEFLNL